MSNRKWFAVTLWAVVFSFLLTCAAGTAQAAVLSAPLIEQLRQGGYVLLMRHASSPQTPPDKAAADPENTTDERQLDEKGRATAKAMGDAIRALHIPVGAVLSSPTYRALETVRLAALGAAKTYPELGDGGHSMQASAVADEAGWLRGKVSEMPARGTNTIIVTHMPNIAAAFAGAAKGITDGATLVYRPEGHGRSELIAKIAIGDWPAFAAGR